MVPRYANDNDLYWVTPLFLEGGMDQQDAASDGVRAPFYLLIRSALIRAFMVGVESMSRDQIAAQKYVYFFRGWIGRGPSRGGQRG